MHTALQPLKRLEGTMRAAESCRAALPAIEAAILTILEADTLSLYQKNSHHQYLRLLHETGAPARQLHLRTEPTSLPGFVALTGRAVRVDDSGDRQARAQLHPRLVDSGVHEPSAGAALALPIEHNSVLLGVLHIRRHHPVQPFTEADLQLAVEIAAMFGNHFHYDLHPTSGPFAHLITRQLLTARQLAAMEQRAAQTHQSIARLLTIEQGLAKADVGDSLERHYQVPFHRFDPDRELPADLMAKLSVTYLRRHCWVPIGESPDTPTVVIDNPNDQRRVIEIQQAIGVGSCCLQVGIREEILSYLTRTPLETPRMRRHAATPAEDDSAIIRFVNKVICDACAQQASDIHIDPCPHSRQGVVRFRVDGVCRDISRIPVGHLSAVIARIKIMACLDIAEHRRPQDGKLAAQIGRRKVEIRTAIIPTVAGESAVLRILAAGGPMGLDQLDMHPEVLTSIRAMAGRPQGLLLITGPTGSGKTTTLHAILGEINTSERKIWTAEDPVEITQQGLQQVQVRTEIGFGFAQALRSFLRADPDVILIGEMRDRETATIAVQAAMTGHLVLSTLHTNSAVDSVSRLIGMGIDRLDLADALLGVLAQRLVRGLCTHCCQLHPPTAAQRRYLQEYGLGDATRTLPHPRGCGACGNTGYQGRIGLHELLCVDNAFRHKLIAGATSTELHAAAARAGMRTLLHDGMIKACNGSTTLEQVRRIV